MIKKFKKPIDRWKEFDVLLTDFFKALDCISHPRLTAKIYNYGIYKNYTLQKSAVDKKHIKICGIYQIYYTTASSLITIVDLNNTA